MGRSYVIIVVCCRLVVWTGRLVLGEVRGWADASFVSRIVGWHVVAGSELCVELVHDLVVGPRSVDVVDLVHRKGAECLHDSVERDAFFGGVWSFDNDGQTVEAFDWVRARCDWRQLMTVLSIFPVNT